MVKVLLLQGADMSPLGKCEPTLGPPLRRPVACSWNSV